MTRIVTPELLEDRELMASLKKIEAMAARDGTDMTATYAAIEAAYQAGCKAAQEAAEARKHSDC